MTEARGSGERPAPGPLGEAGPSWSGDGELTDELTAATAAAGPAAPESAAPSMPSMAAEGELVKPAGYELATFKRRFLGFAVDNLIVVAMLVVFNAMLGLNADSLTESETRVFSLINILVQFAYWWVWNSVGWSPGKRVVGLRIVTEDGAVPGIDRGFRRTVMSLVSQLVLFGGYLWALRDARNQTWHDKAGRTFVVVAPVEDQHPL